MAEEKTMRLSQVLRILNVGKETIIEKLTEKGHRIDNNPNSKLNFDQLQILAKAFGANDLIGEPSSSAKSHVEEQTKSAGNDEILYFREKSQSSEATAPKEEPKAEKEIEKIKIEHIIQGPVVLGKIDLSDKSNPKIITPEEEAKKTELAKAEQAVVETVVAPKETIIPVQEVPAPAVEPVIEKVEIVKEEVQPVAPKVEEKTIVEPVVEIKEPVIVPVVEAPVVVAPVIEIETPVQPVVETKIEEVAPVVSVKQPEPKPEVVETKIEKVKPVLEKKKHILPKTKEDDLDVVVDVPKAILTKTKLVLKPKKPIIVEEEDEEPELIQGKAEKLQGLKVLGKIELPVEKKSNDSNDKKKRKRKRVKRGEKVNGASEPAVLTPKSKEPPKEKAVLTKKDKTTSAKITKKDKKEQITDSDVKEQIKQTMARMQGKGTDFGAKYRRDKRKTRAEQEEAQNLQDQEASSTIRVTEFISAADLASLMDVTVNEVISTCISMGMFVSINQRLDAEAIQMIALEFGFDVEFISAEEEINSDTIEVEDNPEDLQSRAPIVTIMGHVDHGKTSLLDYIRRSRVADGEAGGITQHIGAYSVKMKEGPNKGKMVTFLDTPGHEAFTAMRARGAKVTDVVIIVVAADDSVMPQTREAINHALNAGVPIVFALNKIDKPGANTAKIREDLSKENILVESWGGKYQEQEVSAKKGIGIDELLDKVLLEAELLDLKANPNRAATGTIIEAMLDKGRGYVSTVLIEKGTLKVGDIILAGQHFGRVRAMVNDRGERIKQSGPSTPVQILGLPGAPQAGDRFNIMETEREAREIANKREQIIREQSIRAKKHITLEEIGRRKAIGSFQELNVIVKGDVDGSVEALSDSLLKLSTSEVQVRIIHKAVGQISESDVLLASAADAVIIGFQVRPSNNARKIAENEQIEIRLYSIIYDAINELRDAMEGMLAPKEEEIIMGTIEVREVFKISKIGTIAGCYVTDGIIKRNNKVRVVRDGIVMHEGEISQLKRYKDDVAEVRNGFECGLSVKGFNDIEVGDTIESFDIKEVKRKL